MVSVEHNTVSSSGPPTAVQRGEKKVNPSLLMEDTRFKVSHPFVSHGRSQTREERSYSEQSAQISFVPDLIQEKRGISLGAPSPPVPLSTTKIRRSSTPL